MPETTCCARKPHADLFRTAFRAACEPLRAASCTPACEPLPAASCTPAQATGHYPRCRNAAAARA